MALNKLWRRQSARKRRHRRHKLTRRTRERSHRRTARAARLRRRHHGRRRVARRGRNNATAIVDPGGRVFDRIQYSPRADQNGVERRVEIGARLLAERHASAGTQRGGLRATDTTLGEIDAAGECLEEKDSERLGDHVLERRLGGHERDGRTRGETERAIGIHVEQTLATLANTGNSHAAHNRGELVLSARHTALATRTCAPHRVTKALKATQPMRWTHACNGLECLWCAWTECGFTIGACTEIRC
jgi:hypothetical protein